MGVFPKGCKNWQQRQQATSHQGLWQVSNKPCEVCSLLRNVVAWIELLIICVWRGWAVSESGLLSRSSPWARIVIKLTSLNVVNLLLNPVEKTELAKIREEPVRDWSWISQKSPSPFSKSLQAQFMVGLIYLKIRVLKFGIKEIKGRCL